MNEQRIKDTAAKTGMADEKTLTILSNALIATKDLAGDVVELGCFRGITTRFMCETLKELGSNKRVHVFDSFQGVPVKLPEDEGSILDIPDGGCATSYAAFMKTFEGADFPLPFVNEGWFEDTLPQRLPELISVAFCDGDRYSSMKISLDSVIPRMVKGGIISMHDYACLTGAKKAVDEHRSDFSEFYVEGNECWAVI